MEARDIEKYCGDIIKNQSPDLVKFPAFFKEVENVVFHGISFINFGYFILFNFSTKVFLKDYFFK